MIRPLLLRRTLRKHQFARAALEHRSANICIVDQQGNVCLVNPPAERLLGWSEEDLLGKDLHDTIHHCRRSEHLGVCPLQEAARAATMFQRHDDVLRRKDGTTVPVTYLTSPLVLEGQVAGTIFVFHDMTREHQAERELRDREFRYRCLAEAAPEPMWLVDAYGYITTANAPAAAMFGCDQVPQLLQINTLELFSLEDRPRIVQAKQRAARDAQPHTEAYTLRNLSGGTQDSGTAILFSAEVSVLPVVDDEGAVKAVLYRAVDRTRPVAAVDENPSVTTPASLEQEVALTLSGSTAPSETISRLLQTICEYGHWEVGAYWQLDPDEQLLRCHDFWHVPPTSMPAFEALSRQLSFAPGVDLPGRVWRANEAVWVSDMVADNDILRALVASKEGLHGAFGFPISVGGALHGVMEFTSRRIRQPDRTTLDAADSISAQIGWFLERHQAERALRYRALHDELTGLPNRTLLLDRLRRALFVTRETNKPLALFLIDLDGFAELNERYGRQTGDTLLQQASRRLAGALRDSDTVARLGGDQFAVLLPTTAEGGALIVAEKIVEALYEPFHVEGSQARIGGSIGIALYPDHGRDASLLMRAADAAMYVAKRSKTGYTVYTPGQELSVPLDLPTQPEPSSNSDRAPLAAHAESQA